MTVQIRDSDGTVRLSGDLLATGGATGDVLTQQADGTYAPAVGGSQPVTRAQYDLALAGAPAGVPNKLPFAFNYGTELLDLSDPTNPTPFESGTYSFAATIAISDLTEAVARWTLSVLVDEDDFGAELAEKNVAVTAEGSGTSMSVTLPFYVPAGSPCFVNVRHDDGAGADFNGHCYVQRIS